MAAVKGKGKVITTTHESRQRGPVVRRFLTCWSCAEEVELMVPYCPHCDEPLQKVRMGIEYEDGSIISADQRVRRDAPPPEEPEEEPATLGAPMPVGQMSMSF